MHNNLTVLIKRHIFSLCAIEIQIFMIIIIILRYFYRSWFLNNYKLKRLSVCMQLYIAEKYKEKFDVLSKVTDLIPDETPSSKRRISPCLYSRQLHASLAINVFFIGTILYLYTATDSSVSLNSCMQYHILKLLQKLLI